MDVLALACHGHERGHVSADPTIGACWEADRLELVRVGMRPRAALMSTAAGQAAARNRLDVLPAFIGGRHHAGTMLRGICGSS
ncbi:hypothetical protein [Deinococcus sp.]|uniref:hypothetical protein n=1 Tax=Deinococcus sp. TaxID=47478 RepID=UPI0028699423|nr:hypothetical protein [Deinococcus sp.]